VIRTRVGYTGGTAPHPAYHRMGDHSEAVQVDFDPNVISYRELLDVFWDRHNPVKPNVKRQYMNAVFVHNEAQKTLAEETREEVASGLAILVTTHILSAGIFTLAEDYHQKFRLRGNPALLDAFFEIYPDFDDIVNSTAAARVNGYLAGYGTREQLEAEIASFSLSEKAREILWEGLGKRYGWGPV
jgi:peptide-methionine (S)-S-oxide reductase